jgi:hypothetical protein
MFIVLKVLPFQSFISHCSRPYWRCYYSNTDAIIYVVDSADRDRIGISKDELLYMLRVSVLSGLDFMRFSLLVTESMVRKSYGPWTILAGHIELWTAYLYC